MVFGEKKIKLYQEKHRIFFSYTIKNCTSLDVNFQKPLPEFYLRAVENRCKSKKNFLVSLKFFIFINEYSNILTSLKFYV